MLDPEGDQIGAAALESCGQLQSAINTDYLGLVRETLDSTNYCFDKLIASSANKNTSEKGDDINTTSIDSIN